MIMGSVMFFHKKKLLQNCNHDEFFCFTLPFLAETTAGWHFCTEKNKTKLEEVKNEEKNKQKGEKMHEIPIYKIMSCFQCFFFTVYVNVLFLFIFVFFLFQHL